MPGCFRHTLSSLQMLHHEFAADHSPFAIPAALVGSSPGGAHTEQGCTGCTHLGLSASQVSQLITQVNSAEGGQKTILQSSSIISPVSHSSGQFPVAPFRKYGSVPRPQTAFTHASSRLLYFLLSSLRLTYNVFLSLSCCPNYPCAPGPGG